ncbi:ATP-utilizing phosphoenolpyruvate carboxykinase [Linderina pennispora]|uniref:Phosphoenolpyruvate carboxykinase (ATP) n=1 Tax=Linderina pennispora TaxID=61395 RepID=A0A1Y1VZT8_9FUNG|nr:ATP-utilizing phosphoenolpyruvate carboxykinase [Linderina pennispora]ORX66787.1 ATP-utilizing phosphoenolpyruvate carboxykinase [Linderina pennispora]
MLKILSLARSSGGRALRSLHTHAPFLSGLIPRTVRRNAAMASLYEDAVRYEPGTCVSSVGALVARSGNKTGRSPKDKRVVKEASTVDDVWWGPVNKKLSEESFAINYERAVDYLNTRERLYYRIKVRVVCARAYHALFMNNMLIRPTAEELENFGEPDFTIINAGQFPASTFTEGMTSSTSVSISFKHKQMVILGTEYAGEMKKGVFTVMHYLMPKANALSLHASCNEGRSGDVSLFFGLSGTGKTTLSADPQRLLIGDDEHVWTESGVFNIEGGCYAKCIDLSAEKEPEIFRAIRFGSVLGELDYTDKTITENTRCAYPIEHMDSAKVPCVGGHPKNIVLLTCDAFGVLPPVAKLTPAQAMYHFISGYTAKIAGTEEGVKAPVATFSACFGQPFLVWHPVKYARMLAEKLQKHNASVWLVNTGWAGGAYGVGKRISLKHSRQIIDAIHSGELEQAEYANYPVFNLQIPRSVTGVPSEILDPLQAWQGSPAEFHETIGKLAGLFSDNFTQYADQATPEITAAAPAV